MVFDVNKALATLAAMPEVKKIIKQAREVGVADAIATLGLGSRSMLIPGFGFFAAGAVCGAAAAMLITPRTGEAFRSDIADLYKKLSERVNDQVQTVKSTAEDRLRQATHSNASNPS